MAFGKELSDFVDGFTAGYEMVDSKEDKEAKRAERKRAQEAHDRAGEWGEEDRRFREDQRDYSRSRDAVSDERWERQFDFGEQEFDYRREQNEQERRDRQRREGITDERYFEDRAWEREKYKRDQIPTGDDAAIPEAFDEYTPPSALPEDGDQSSLMDGATAQLASYSPDAAGGFDLNTYLPSIKAAESGGRRNARNPNSSAQGLYQPLKGTWREVAQKYPELGLTPNGRSDPAQQERFIRRFTYDNGKVLASAGIPVTNGTMYAAHFLGAGGAKQVLRADPSTPIARLVSSDVMQANPHLRGMDVNDFRNWAERKANGVKRRRTVNAARGGMISALPEDEDEPDFTMAPEAAEAPEQVAEAIPTPTPRPAYEGDQVMEGEEEAPTDDPYEQGRRAVRDGMKQAMKQAEIDMDSAIDDPELEKRRQNYLRGYGAAPKQLMKQAKDKIDPDRKMSASERNLKAIGTVYQFFMDQGDYEKAQEAAASMVQAYKQESQQFLALAQAAAQKGDHANAAKAAVAAYANIPNGRELTIEQEGDGYVVKVVDEKTGKVVTNKLITPREMAAAAMNFSPATFDEEILNAAGAPAEEVETSSPSDLADTGVALDGTLEDMLAESELSPDRQKGVRDIAMGIAQVKANGMDADQAARFAIDLMKFDANDPENNKGNFEIKPRRADPDNVDIITPNGTVTIPKNAAIVLENLRGTMAGEREAAVQEGKDNKKWWGEIGEDAADFGRSVRDIFRDTGDRITETTRSTNEAIPDSLSGGPEGRGGRRPAPFTPAGSGDANAQIEQLMEERQKLMYGNASGQSNTAAIQDIDRQIEQLEAQANGMPTDGAIPTPDRRPTRGSEITPKIQELLDMREKVRAKRGPQQGELLVRIGRELKRLGYTE